MNEVNNSCKYLSNGWLSQRLGHDHQSSITVAHSLLIQKYQYTEMVELLDKVLKEALSDREDKGYLEKYTKDSFG